MAGLKATTARLAAYQRQWHKLRAEGGAGSTVLNESRLAEIEDFGLNPGNLRMLTCVPENLPDGAPLVVVLHGCQQNAGGYDVGAGWSTLAERFRFALLLPEQRTANNPNACFNWFLPGDTIREAGEPSSILRMIERLLLDHKLDRSRIFVTGLSAGGAMTSVMLATYPEIFAGGAIIAGLPYGVAGNVQQALDAMFKGASRSAAELGDRVRAASAHRGPWPRISIWHGSADVTVQATNAREIEKQWGDVHGVDASSAAMDMVDGYPRRSWRNPAGETVIESYTITGMAHGTPIAAGDGDQPLGVPAPFILEAGISSSYRIAQFWGIADGSAGARQESRPQSSAKPGVIYLPKASSPAPTENATPPKADAATGGGLRLDPQAVINKALRAAGLLRQD